MFLTQWLIKHGVDPIKQYQMGVFDMEVYTKCVRLKYIESKYDEQNTDYFVWITLKGIEYIKEHTK